MKTFECLLDKEQAITCGSAIKLRYLGISSKHYLNSGEMTWGTGSGQQVVTIGKTKNSSSSLWQVRERSNSNVPCITGKAFHCNDIIRLMHVPTKKNLHTHSIPATLTKHEQEISAFGDENGQGDDSDDWKLICSGDIWKRNTIVQFQHVVTNKYLTSSPQRKFTTENCPNCPILHHLEVTGSSSSTKGSNFRAEIGAFIHL